MKSQAVKVWNALRVLGSSIFPLSTKTKHSKLQLNLVQIKKMKRHTLVSPKLNSHLVHFIKFFVAFLLLFDEYVTFF